MYASNEAKLSSAECYFCAGSRETEDGTVEYNQLYYQCNRVLADLFYSVDVSKRHLEFTKRYLVLKDVSRHVMPRRRSDRRVLQKLPILLHNSAPESDILDEFKDKVYFSYRKTG